MSNPSFKNKIIDFLTLEPHILGLFIAIFLINLGEKIWSEFFSLYFIALGGTVVSLGVFKSLSDAFDAFLQLPGGMISDKWGRINASIGFIIFGIGGYIVYAISPSWQFLFIGLIMVQGTSSLLQPTVFAIIGDSISPEKRTNAFSVQSILKRLPRIIAPMIGGFIFNSMGIFKGVRLSLWITVLIGIIALFLLFYIKKLNLENHKKFKNEVNNKSKKTKRFQLPKELHPLLIADIFVRFGKAMVKALLILYVATIVNLQIVGILLGFQVTVSILSYLPAAVVAEKIGKKPVVIISFLCFSLYPILTIYSTTVPMLFVAYFIAGFREFGEPARKAMIVDRCNPDSRGENVGLYYTIRSLSIIPGSIVGAYIWVISPKLTGLIAMIIVLIGLLIFSIFVHEPISHRTF